MQGKTVGDIGVSKVINIAANGHRRTFGRATGWNKRVNCYDLWARAMISPKRPTQIELTDFMGCWRVERAIRHADGTEAQFQGTATWTPDGTGALYVENGRLSMAGGASFHAERRYVWDHDLKVYFEDGRFFHSVPIKGEQATHDCAPDTYRVDYDFDAWPTFRVVWHVTGPRKDYVSNTIYTRQPD